MLFKNPIYIIFLGLILFDIMTGFIKAIIWKQWDSNTGIKGISKHTLIFSLITGLYIANNFLASTVYATELQYILHGFTLYYSFCYINSILENFGVMGIPYPGWLKVKVEDEKNKLDKNLKWRKINE